MCSVGQSCPALKPLICTGSSLTDSGWSTTLLNSVGNLYICGGINASAAYTTRRVRRSGVPLHPLSLRMLSFPPAYPPSTKERYEPSTAIASFSTGRAHILGHSDDGTVWQWNNEVARQVRPLHVNTGGSRVKRVVAGRSLPQAATLTN